VLAFAGPLCRRLKKLQRRFRQQLRALIRPQAQPRPRRGAHNALQLLIVLWTVLALFVLLNALRVGLLGYPELLIAGNGSSSRELHWYTDRVAS
jgi:hypothetical protein